MSTASRAAATGVGVVSLAAAVSSAGYGCTGWVATAATAAADPSTAAAATSTVVPPTLPPPSGGADATAAVAGAHASALYKWGDGSTLNKLNRSDPTRVDTRRRVVVLVGITGAGKSSTANTMMGRVHKHFTLANSMTSVTTAVSFRDYAFLGVDWRVVDTPGLFDTHRSAAAVTSELGKLVHLTPHGAAAVVFVVPHGRFTAEHEAALRSLITLFGDAVASHAIIAVTSALDATSERRQLLTRDQLVDEINGLPTDHLLRRLVESAGYRVVPVENRLDPHRQISRMLLHQRVLDVIEHTAGVPFDTRRLLPGAAAGTSPAPLLPPCTTASTMPGAPFDLGALRLTACTPAWDTRPGDGALLFRLTCEVQQPPTS